MSEIKSHADRGASATRHTALRPGPSRPPLRHGLLWPARRSL